jgi:hypothetical protein
MRAEVRQITLRVFGDLDIIHVKNPIGAIPNKANAMLRALGSRACRRRFEGRSCSCPR